MAYSGSPEALYVPGQGILLCTGVTPDIDWYDLDGNPTRRLRLGLDPEPVTAEEREAIQQRMQESYEGDQDRSPPGMAVLRRDKLKFHDYKAFWNRVEVDDEGYLWLGIPEEPSDRAPQDGRLNRVISPAGEYLGDSRWPCRSGSVFRGMFLGQVEDEYTGEMVPTVFRIVPIVAGLDYP